MTPRVIAGSFWPNRMVIVSGRSPLDIFLSTRTRSVHWNGIVANLTKSEFGVVLLTAVARTVVTREAIFDYLYGECEDGGPLYTKGLDVFLCHIRCKLEQFPISVKTVWGVGLRLEVAEVCLEDAAE